MAKRHSARLSGLDGKTANRRKTHDGISTAQSPLLGTHIIDTLEAAADGQVAVPRILLYSMASIMEGVPYPLAAIELNLDGSEARLLCASRGAIELLDAQTNLNKSNRCLSEFLGHCAALHHRPVREIRWKGSCGTMYRLEGELKRRQGVEFSLVRFVLEDEEKATDDELKEAALEKGLTIAETKAFLLMAKGLANKEIAKVLDSSVHTIRAHLRSIFRTLNVSGRVEAINAVRKKY